MVDKIVVHFRSGRKKRTVTIAPNGRVKGVIFKGRATFANPPSDGGKDDLKDEDFEIEQGPETLLLSEILPGEGPGVCYWVDDTLVCW